MNDSEVLHDMMLCVVMHALIMRPCSFAAFDATLIIHGAEYKLFRDNSIAPFDVKI